MADRTPGRSADGRELAAARPDEPGRREEMSVRPGEVGRGAGDEVRPGASVGGQRAEARSHASGRPETAADARSGLDEGREETSVRPGEVGRGAGDEVRPGASVGGERAEARSHGSGGPKTAADARSGLDGRRERAAEARSGLGDRREGAADVRSGAGVRPEAVEGRSARGEERRAAKAWPGEGRLLPPESCDKYGLRLQHAVGEFVDSPREAVEEADRVVEEVAAELADALVSRRRTLKASWQDTGDGTHATPDTEQLRLALRDYRATAERLLGI
ncbi:hypothetical protein ABZ468_11550 [Streptomyces sp. NPDC005708]|uniref:hypothetical protein n=2 Tax=unclassified Streptomyces TaxID=2593676 RepID=UPI0034014C29